MLRSRRLHRSLKVSVYKDAVMFNVTFDYECVTLCPRAMRKCVDINADCCAVLSHRVVTAEKTKSSFNVMKWIWIY